MKKQNLYHFPFLPEQLQYYSWFGDIHEEKELVKNSKIEKMCFALPLKNCQNRDWPDDILQINSYLFISIIRFPKVQFSKHIQSLSSSNFRKHLEFPCFVYCKIGCFSVTSKKQSPSKVTLCLTPNNMHIYIIAVKTASRCKPFLQLLALHLIWIMLLKKLIGIHSLWGVFADRLYVHFTTVIHRN